MSKYTKRFIYTTSFDGDEYTFELSRLKRKHALKLLDHADVDDTGKVTATFQDNVAMLDTASEFIGNYIHSVTGPMLDGEPLTVADLTEEAYFMELLGDVCAAVFENSFPSKVERKKSAASPEDTSAA